MFLRKLVPGSVAFALALTAGTVWAQRVQIVATPRPTPRPKEIIQNRMDGPSSGTQAGVLRRLPGRPVNFGTRDELGVYTARPMLAVGDVKSVDLTSRTITVKIIRDLSSVPHLLMARARKKQVEQRLLERIFPAERTFIIRRTTTLMDSSRLTTATRTQSMTTRERFEAMRIKPEDFKPGDRVSVQFIYHENDEKPPSVLNVSKQPRDRRDYDADFRQAPVISRDLNDIRLTTRTLANGQVTSSVLPAGVFVPPKLPAMRPTFPPGWQVPEQQKKSGQTATPEQSGQGTK